MKKTIKIALFMLILCNLYSQEYDDDDYFDYGLSEGLVIYGDQNKVERKIIEALNKGQEERKSFIHNDLLAKSGFLTTADAKIRKTTGGEKTIAVMHGIFSGITFGLVPKKSFSGVVYDKLPEGEQYNFYAVLVKSELKNVSSEVQKIMELEYKLQMEFLNGVLLPDKNLNYYTEENIEKFEQLILSLPDDVNDIKPIKERFLNIELPKIKSVFIRYKNPSEMYLQAQNNLKW